MTARAFLLGLMADALDGVLLIEVGFGFPVPAIGAIAIGTVVAPIPVGASGTLVGWGTTWAALFAMAARNCAVDRNCGDSPPSVAPWIAIGLGLVVAGFGLLALSSRKRIAR